MQRLTLQRHQWYAMLRLNPFGAQDYCPIWIYVVKPLQTGKGRLKLSFWDATYPEGVQDKVYRLRVMRREPGFVLPVREEDEADGEFRRIVDTRRPATFRRWMRSLVTDWREGIPQGVVGRNHIAPN
jgi:hypothetical protein